MESNVKRERTEEENVQCLRRDLKLSTNGSSAPQQRRPLVPSCLSVKSDMSKWDPPDFSIEPGPSNTLELSPGPRCLSVKSDMSKWDPPDFSIEPGPSDVLSLSGGFSCLRFGERTETLPGQHIEINVHVFDDHKQSVKRRCESVTEGTDTAEPLTPLKSIYTELYITEGPGLEAEAQHELTWMESVSCNKDMVHESPISCNDIFKAFTAEQTSIRVVLTNGVAGVGKTFSVLKFSLDWAEGSENQEVDVLVPLSFRELNLVTGGRYSLLELIQLFHPSLQRLTADTLAHSKLLFIFDGLDETRLTLDFNCEVISEVTQSSEVNVLLVNLIKGNLLPSALIWITSRPAASNQIPVSCVHRVTEVRGFFTDDQKDHYFTKRFTDEELSTKVLCHLRTSQTLHTMCQIPVFCWITATVLEHMFEMEQKEQLPQTLTDLYAHFLLLQIERKRLKYRAGQRDEPTQADTELLLKLGRLAFEQLEKGNIMFYQDDLQQVGLEPTEALVQAGVCTEIFKRDCDLFNKPIYCFVHLSIQEFLAAVYLLHSYVNSEVMKWILGVDIFLKTVTERSLKSQNGHLDLVIQFLHGLCLESNLKLMKGLLGPVEIDPGLRNRVIENLQDMNVKEASADRNINLIHCLMEMNYNSPQEEIQVILKAKRGSMKRLSDIQCSALAYMLQMSEEVLDELDMKSYDISHQGKERLIPAVRNCRKAVLDHGLSDVNCEIVASALMSNPSHLRELEMSHIQDSVLKIVCTGLESPNCRLETLRLTWGRLVQDTFHILGSALKANPSHLRELSLHRNHENALVEQLCDFIQSPDCLLERLRLISCNLTVSSLSSLASALMLSPSHLKELDLNNNKLEDLGMQQLCEFLQSPDCRLESLGLEHCSMTEISSLASALKSNPSHLKQLILNKNTLEDRGVEHLCGFLQSPDCQLEALSVNTCSLTEISCSSLVSALKFNPSHLKELDLSYNEDIKDSGVEHLCGILQTPHCRLETLRLTNCSLTEIGCSSLTLALKSNPSHLKELDLSGNNDLKDSGVEHLCDFLKNPECRLEKLSLNNCGLSKSSFSSITSIVKSGLSSLKELSMIVKGDAFSNEKELQQIGDCQLNITFIPCVLHNQVSEYMGPYDDYDNDRDDIVDTYDDYDNDRNDIVDTYDDYDNDRDDIVDTYDDYDNDRDDIVDTYDDYDNYCVDTVDTYDDYDYD